MAIKKVYLKKKIDGVIYDLYTRTSADMVDYTPAGEATTTVAAALASLATGVSNAYTKDETDAELEALYNRIMGFTESDKTINEAYDTLKEVATYLSNNDDAVALITGLAATVGKEAEGANPATGLVADVRALESTVGSDDTAGLRLRIKTNEDDIDALETALGSDDTSGVRLRVKTNEDDIDALETAIGTESTANTILYRIKQLENVGSTKVEASATNGNIRIDDVETVVYNDSALAARVTTAEADIDALETAIGDDATANSVKGRIKALEDVGSTKVEASATNGNIKIDDVETTVYTHPTTHSASMIDETATRVFVTPEEKAQIGTYVVYATSAPAASDALDEALYIVPAE